MHPACSLEMKSRYRAGVGARGGRRLCVTRDMQRAWGQPGRGAQWAAHAFPEVREQGQARKCLRLISLRRDLEPGMLRRSGCESQAGESENPGESKTQRGDG